MGNNAPELIDLEIIKSGRINGVQYGPNVRVFARTKVIMLIWVPGHSYYGGINRQAYAESSMRVVPRHEHGWRDLSSGRICEAERLKLSLFRDHAEKIDSFFGEGVWRLLEPRRTLVLDNSEPFSSYGHEMPITGREFGYEHVMRKAEFWRELKEAGHTGINLEMLTNKRMQEFYDNGL